MDAFALKLYGGAEASSPQQQPPSKEEAMLGDPCPAQKGSRY